MDTEAQQNAEEQSKRGECQSEKATRDEMGGAVETLEAKDAEETGTVGTNNGGTRGMRGGRLVRSRHEGRRRRAPGATPVPRLLCRLSRMLHRKCDLLRDLSL